MENFEQLKTMSCGSTDKKIADLEKDGWKYAYSFHAKISEQWSMACDKVNEIQNNGDWEAIIVQSQDEAEKRDTVRYIYKKKTEQRIDWEKKQGYL